MIVAVGIATVLGISAVTPHGVRHTTRRIEAAAGTPSLACAAVNARAGIVDVPIIEIEIKAPVVPQHSCLASDNFVTIGIDG